MKVAFILSKFPCYDEAFLLRELHGISRQTETVLFSLRGGSEPVLHDEARELMARVLYLPYLLSWEMLRVHLVWIMKSPARYFRALRKVIAGNFGSAPFLLRSLVLFPKIVLFADWAKKNGVTHIHACWATHPATAAYVAHALTGIPYSLTGHAHDIYLDTTFLREKMESSKFISTCTESNKEYLAKIAPSVERDRILVLHHGLDLSKFETGGVRSNDVYEILSVGTLQPHKGFSFLLEALGLLRERSIAFHCTIAGGGPDEKKLKELCARLGLSGEVTFTGPLKQRDVLPLYKKADVSVLMAQGEWHWGIPNVLIESLAARTAVITTRFGSVEELVKNQETGLIVPAKDPGPLADALELYWRRPDLRQSHAKAGYQSVLNGFDLTGTLREYLERFRQ